MHLLPRRFAVRLHERADPLQEPHGGPGPEVFENWVGAVIDRDGGRYYGYRAGQAERGDVGCSELVIADGVTYFRESSPGVPEVDFAAGDDLPAIDELVAELASLPLVDEVVAALAGVDVDQLDGGPLALDTPSLRRLLGELTTMGLPVDEFGAGEVTATFADDGTLSSLTLRGSGVGDRFDGVDVDVVLDTDLSELDLVDPTTSVGSTPGCQVLAPELVGPWSVTTEPGGAVGAMVDVGADGEVEIDIACWDQPASAQVGPYGFVDIDERAGCDGDSLGDTLAGPQLVVGSFGDLVVMTSTGTGGSAILTRES